MRNDKRKQYFIALIPPSPVYEDTFKLKEYVRDVYHSKAALNSPPHITLHMPFFWNEEKENKLVTKLEEFTRRSSPMKICLDNFGSFPPRVIYINVTESDALEKLQKELHGFFKRELDIFNANYRDRPYHPHLTLAFRDLKKPQYTLAWKEFSAREYKAEFMADKLAVLKHNGKKWEVFREFLMASAYSTDANPGLRTTE